MSVVQSSGVFRYFPRLPAEIRDHIWALCLPHRVRELDKPIYWNIFPESSPAPCTELVYTMYRNAAPPLISRVCHESRAVALEARGDNDAWSLPQEHPAHWTSTIGYGERCWRDRTRDSPHLNWLDMNSVLGIGFEAVGSPFGRLAWETACTSGQGSFLRELLEGDETYQEVYPFKRFLPPPGHPKSPIGPTQIRDRDALLELSRWQVVMEVMVIHTTVADAAATGLFGLFCEEIVQVVDAADARTCDAFHQFAQACERRASGPVTAPQKYTRDLAAMRQRLRFDILNSYDCEELVERLHPAIMFRLCTRQCNERTLTKKEIEKMGGPERLAAFYVEMAQNHSQ